MTLPALLDDNSYIQNTLKKFSVSDQAIAELSAKYSTLEIKGIDDKAGYEAVSTARKDVKSLRVAVEKKRKEIGEIPLKITREINKEASRLTILIEAIEEPLEAKEKAYEAEIERIKQEKIRAAEERFKARIAQLLKYGFNFHGKNYIADLKIEGWPDSRVIAESEHVKAIDDEQFNGFIKLIDEAYNKRQIELEEAKKKQQEEAENAEQERKALADKLAEAQAKIDQMEREKREQEDKERKEKELENFNSHAAGNFSIAESENVVRVGPVYGQDYSKDVITVLEPEPSKEEVASVSSEIDIKGEYKYASLEIRYNLLVQRIKKYLKPATVKALLEGLE